jgi:hypothetical protein
MERLHAPNEFFRIRRLREGMRAWEELWRLLADGPQAARVTTAETPYTAYSYLKRGLMAVINAFAQDAVDRAEPLTVAAAYARCRDAALAESAIGAIGLEIESHLVDLDHVADPVPWRRVEAIAAVVGRVAPGTAVTVEPGGQIELSGPPEAGVGPAVARLRYQGTGARLALAERRLGLAFAGADPARPSRRVNPRPRYRAMEQHFAATGRAPAGRVMMNSTAAAGQSPGRPQGRVAGQGRAGVPARPDAGGDRGELALAARPRYGLEVGPAAGLGRARRAHVRPGAGLRSEARPRRVTRSRLSLGPVRDARPGHVRARRRRCPGGGLLGPVLAVGQRCGQAG